MVVTEFMTKDTFDVFEKTITKVPDFQAFMTVNELDESSDKLAEEFSGTVRQKEIGRTRNGERISALFIGAGKKTALLFGAPHPNEPIGTLLLDYFSWELARNDELRAALDYTFVIVKVADKDGLRLNEGWLKGPFTVTHYARNFYRPGGDTQVEWTFPIRYKDYSFDSPIPETRALMSIMDAYKPDFIYSLHNAGFGGAYYYINVRAPLLDPIFQLYPKFLGVPLSLGEPEVPWAVKYSSAIYKLLSLRDNYEFLKKQDVSPFETLKSGGSSLDYASSVNPGVCGLVSEVPYFYDPRIEDLSETEQTRKESVLARTDEAEARWKYIASVLAKLANAEVRKRDRFAEALLHFSETQPKSLEATRKWAETDPLLARKATVAEVFDNQQVSKFYMLLMFGMLLRMAKGKAVDSSIATPLTGELESQLDEQSSSLESELRYKVIPLRDLVRIQLSSGLYTMLYLQDCC